MISFDEREFKSYVVETVILDEKLVDGDGNGWINFVVTVEINNNRVKIPFTFYIEDDKFKFPVDAHDFEYIHEAGGKIFGLLYFENRLGSLAYDFTRLIYKLGVAEYKRVNCLEKREI